MKDSHCIISLLLIAAAWPGWGASADVAPPPSCLKQEPYQISGHSTRFCRLETGELISANCFSGSGQLLSGCLAFKASRPGVRAAVPQHLDGLESSVMVGCVSKGGKITYTRDEAYNQYCFCAFRDKSIINCSALNHP